RIGRIGQCANGQNAGLEVMFAPVLLFHLSALSVYANVINGVMRDEFSMVIAAFGNAVNMSSPQSHDLGRANYVFTLGRTEKRRRYLGRYRRRVFAEPRYDRQPHRYVRRRHQRRAADDAART